MAEAKRFFDDFFFAAFLCDINRGLRTRMPSSAWKITRKLRCKQKANIYVWMENCAMNKQNHWNESAKENKWQFLTMFRNDTPPRVLLMRMTKRVIRNRLTLLTTSNTIHRQRSRLELPICCMHWSLSFSPLEFNYKIIINFQQQLLTFINVSRYTDRSLILSHSADSNEAIQHI